MTEVWITNKVNDMLKLVLKKGTKKEGLIHSIFVLALTDPQFLKRAQALNRYFGNVGVTKLEDRGL